MAGILNISVLVLELVLVLEVCYKTCLRLRYFETLKKKY